MIAAPVAPSTGGWKGSDRTPALIRYLILAAATYVPLLLTSPGRVAADTKTYLYLDPGRMLERAPSMWDPNIGMGTVTHQNIGYLVPMGPWFWFFEKIGAPDWVAQRLWVATFMFAAGAGVLFLLRSLGWRHDPEADRPLPAIVSRLSRRGNAEADDDTGGLLTRVTGAGALAAAVIYMLSPYVLNYGSRLSVLLLPWAGLPWLIGLTQRALRSGSWRHPALFAIVVTLIGGVNATSLVLAGIGPLLWVPFAVWVHHDVTFRDALAAVGRIGVLTVGSSLWWMSGLAAQGSYGIDILKYSESVPTVAHTSTAPEVMRGLGYWFFYGGEKAGPWIPSGRKYMGAPWLLTLSFLTAGLAIVAAVTLRWRYRAFFIGMVVLGTAVAVGAYPYTSPSPIGGVFKHFANSSTAGLAMRSTPRAVPLIILGVAILVGAGLSGLARMVPRRAAAASALVILVAALGLPPLWTGNFIGENLQRPEDVPEYWHAAAAYLDEQGNDTRVLEIPGSDFASYRWGTTIDPITPGLMDRPYVARELIPYGSPPSADLLNALDRRFQDDVLDPDVLAPIARRLGVGDIVLRSDLAYEHYRTPRPKPLWAKLNPPPDGLDAPVGFGEPVPNQADPRFPMKDEIEEVTPPDASDPPPVAVFPVKDPVPIIRTATADRPLLMAGDGEGVVASAAAGLLDDEAPLFYSASLAGDPELRERLLDAGAHLVLTDSNRKRGRRWSTVWENSGYTEPAGSEPIEDDVSDNRLPLFPDADDDAFTTVEHRGVKEITASRYGNPVTFTPEDRAANAFDGDLGTAWSVGDFSPVQGERILLRLNEPITTDHIEVVQPLAGARDRYITSLEVVLDGESIGTFPLDESSREEGGQSVDIGRRTFSSMELVVDNDNIGKLKRYGALSPVGFAEIRVGDINVDEIVRLPSDLLVEAGERSSEHDLTILLERARGQVVTGRADEEEALVRGFDLPTPRRFTLEGDARVNAYAPEPMVDQLLGIPSVDDGGMTVETSSYLRGNFPARGSSALDGDPSTVWRTQFGEPSQIDAFIEVSVPEPVTIDRLDLELVADGEHSVPTRLVIKGDGESRTVDVPAVTNQKEAGATVPVSVEFDPLTTDKLKVVIEKIRPEKSIEYYTEKPGVRPIGIAELGIPGVRRPDPSAVLAQPCRDDLLEFDGKPLEVKIIGSLEDATNRAPLAIELCGRSADGISADAGDQVLRSMKGSQLGFDIDRLVLRSDAAGKSGEPQANTEAPDIKVLGSGRTGFDLEVSGATEPFWLVLGQSHNSGWTGKIEGGESLGEPTLIEGYANGWYIDPEDKEQLAVTLEWTPQRQVRSALVVSSLFLILCLGIVAWGWRRRGEPVAVVTADAGSGAGPALAELASPLSYDWGDKRPRPVPSLILTLLCGAMATLVVSPLAGLIVGAAVALAVGLVLTGRRGRPVLTGGAIVAFGSAVFLIVLRQIWREGVQPDFEWPAYFPISHALAWIAIMLMASDLILGLLLTRRRSRHRGS